MKAVKTPIFMFCFLIIGLMFWPIAIWLKNCCCPWFIGCCQLDNDSNIECCCLRASLQYLQMNPLDSVTTVVVYHLVEFFPFISFIVYFGVSFYQVVLILHSQNIFPQCSARNSPPSQG
ncbi:hypothetical protein BCR33DRAFT_721108 [Rhizoclosmatium globosum]|uniref:Uncharacterized protein n=1 Tax=Rhizoclosmatium globosum TaxID=329046 RepID=A0A1Y2BT20_9FUNG|nr:hypothetical protein BCR33DRAFT_721108 [Rhizoclosmatium globosum]|eukprot:ORY37908.1 hypothetical protein BCR33DRAFT_721108 [Rhizoclosmatium globosum]